MCSIHTTPAELCFVSIRILIVRWKQHSRSQCSLNDFQMRSLTLKLQLERKTFLIFKKWSPSISDFSIIPESQKALSQLSVRELLMGESREEGREGERKRWCSKKLMEVFLSLAKITNTVWRLHNPSESCVAVLKTLPYIHSRETEDHQTDKKVLKAVKRNTITLTAEISTVTLKTGGNGWNDDFNEFWKKKNLTS